MKGTIQMPTKLPWPCSSVERDVLQSLRIEAKRIGKPISGIVKSAVDQYLSLDAIDARVADEFTGYAA
jgi:hypothetical protein